MCSCWLQALSGATVAGYLGSGLEPRSQQRDWVLEIKAKLTVFFLANDKLKYPLSQAEKGDMI